MPKTDADWPASPCRQPMIQACALAEVWTIPHYCYHPKLPVAGNCRMCLVEFGTPAMGPDRKPMLNEDGTPKIAQKSPPGPAHRVRHADFAGHGDLHQPRRREADARRRARIAAHQSPARLPDLRSGRRVQASGILRRIWAGREPLRRSRRCTSPSASISGPRIVLDDERCILCTRCIRFTKDIAGDDALGIINRGSYNTHRRVSRHSRSTTTIRSTPWTSVRWARSPRRIFGFRCASGF